jgi:hypothetical protein
MVDFKRSVYNLLEGFLRNNGDLNDRQPDNSDLRLKYLLNQIDEEEFKSQLYKQDRNRVRKEELKKIYFKVYTELVESLRGIKCGESIDTTKQSIKVLCSTAEDDLKLARKYFGGRIPFLLLETYQWHLQRATLHRCDIFEDQAYEDIDLHDIDTDIDEHYRRRHRLLIR